MPASRPHHRAPAKSAAVALALVAALGMGVVYSQLGATERAYVEKEAHRIERMVLEAAMLAEAEDHSERDADADTHGSLADAALAGPGNAPADIDDTLFPSFTSPPPSPPPPAAAAAASIIATATRTARARPPSPPPPIRVPQPSPPPPAATPSSTARRSDSTGDGICGGMPPDMLPKFSPQRLPRRDSVRLSTKGGFVVASGPFNRGTARVPTEQGPRRFRIERAGKGSLRSGERELVACLRNLAECGEVAASAAMRLGSVQEAAGNKRKGSMFPSSITGKRRMGRCAVVGNSGAMLQQEYGKYIDAHDTVMRINILPTAKYVASLGTKTSFRVLSYKMSKDVCCVKPKSEYTPDSPDVEFFIWFGTPDGKKTIASNFHKRHPSNKLHVMQKDFLDSAVGAFKGMRTDLLRMGQGPFDDWAYMTSGMHAVLGLIRQCESVSVFGFTADLNSKGAYWFTGRNIPPRSGRTQHSWDHERMVLRLLHAAGLLRVCTA